MTIRSKATAKTTAIGDLYAGHETTVHKSSGNWRYITDKNAGVNGFVSESQANHEARAHLNSALHFREFAGPGHFLAAFASDQRSTRSCLTHALPKKKGAMSCPTTPTA
ncbi:hypothetical protein AB0H82_34730 [Streptomyces sp. NPDC050732]|uniref:hypothetical protein n=1 Tax=Streptomyces sp. NPDC050732 TaxID=3154632 RepID=UPI00342EDC3C